MVSPTLLKIGGFLAVAVALAALALVAAPYLGFGSAVSSIPQDQTLATADATTVNYGQPINVELFTPAVAPAAPSSRCPQYPNPSTKAVLAEDDILVTVDGTLQYSFPAYVHDQQYPANSAANALAALQNSIYTLDGPCSGQFCLQIFSQQAIQGNIPLAKLHIGENLLPGNHVVRVYHTAGTASVNQDAGYFGCQVDYNYGINAPWWGVGNQQRTYAEYNITVLNATDSCTDKLGKPATAQGGYCSYPKVGDCLPGQMTDGGICYYMLTPNATVMDPLLVSNSQQQIQQLQDNLSATNSQLDTATSSLNGAISSLKTAQQQAQDLSAANAQLFALVNATGDSLNTAVSNLGLSIKASVAYRQSIDNYSAQVSMQAASIGPTLPADQQANLLSLQRQAQDARINAVMAESNLNASKAALDSSVANFTAMEGKYAQGSASLSDLQTSLASVSQQLQYTQTALQGAKNSAQASQQIADSLAALKPANAQGLPLWACVPAGLAALLVAAGGVYAVKSKMGR